MYCHELACLPCSAHPAAHPGLFCRSRAALTYAEAQSRIDDERLQDEVSANLRRMNAVARVLRRQRAERGALQLASPEVKFEIDTETHDPLDVGMYQVSEVLQPLSH